MTDAAALASPSQSAAQHVSPLGRMALHHRLRRRGQLPWADLLAATGSALREHTVPLPVLSSPLLTAGQRHRTRRSAW